MVRVLLPFRGVAVLLLAASTVVGQTPEPPAELPLDAPSVGSVDFLRQFSAEKNHPLLNLMVDGELTSFDASPAREVSPRLKPAPQSQSVSSSAATETTDACPVEIECPTMPMCLPFACPPPPPPPCYCRKCQRKQRHSHCGDRGPGYGNPYLGWPGGYPGCCGAQPYPAQQCCGRRCHHQHGCGYNGYGYPGYGNPYGGGYGGWNTMSGGGFVDGGCCGACTPFLAPPPPPPPPQCHCRKCQRKHGCGNQGYGYPYGGGYAGYGSQYGGGWGMGSGGFMDGGCCAACMPPPPPPPPPQCHCRRCQRKQGCSNGYGYAGYGYPGWPNYPVPGANMADGGYNGFANPNCFGCGKHQRCHGLFGHCRSCHQPPPPYPYCAYPQMMPCMQMEPLCADCGSGGDFLPSAGSGCISN